MIPIDNFIDDAMRKLKKMEDFNCLDIRTYKRDRSVLIERVGDKFNVYENGFFKEVFNDVAYDELKKLLKTMHRKEFLNSSIVRFYKLERKSDGDNHRGK